MTWLIAVLYVFIAFQISVFSTTIYLHRCATHRALALHPVMAALMRVHLWLFTGIVVRQWVAVHRKHHHHTDETGDPHSPYLEGVWAILLGNPLYYRKEAQKTETVAKYAKDIPQHWSDAALDNGWMGILSGVGLSMLIFTLAGRSPLPALAIGGVCYLIQAVSYIVDSALINGACHHFGYKNFANTATNLRWVAWLSGGEGLHNNHHQYPTSAKFSFKRWEHDFAWPVIRLLSKLSLARVGTRSAPAQASKQA